MQTIRQLLIRLCLIVFLAQSSRWEGRPVVWLNLGSWANVFFGKGRMKRRRRNYCYYWRSRRRSRSPLNHDSHPRKGLEDKFVIIRKGLRKHCGRTIYGISLCVDCNYCNAPGGVKQIRNTPIFVNFHLKIKLTWKIVN